MPKYPKKKYSQNVNKGNRRTDVRVSVSGFNGTTTQLINWISKVDQGIKKNIYVTENNGIFIVKIMKPQLLDLIMKLSGEVYSGSIVTVSQMQQTEQNSLQTITNELVSRCYTAGEFAINLDNISQKLKALGWNKNFDPNTLSKIFEYVALSKPALKAIHYCNNDLTSLSAFKNINRWFPSLNALDLRNNNIKQVDQLDHIKDIPLEVLSLNENPIINDPNYYLFVIF